MPCLYLELTGLEVLGRNNGAASAHATRLDGNIRGRTTRMCWIYVTYTATAESTDLSPPSTKKNDPSH